MISILKSADFDAWLRKLRDSEAKARILMRVERLSLGNAGDVRSRGDRIALLLCGGDKSTQRTDIIRAKKIAAEWRDQ